MRGVVGGQLCEERRRRKYSSDQWSMGDMYGQLYFANFETTQQDKIVFAEVFHQGGTLGILVPSLGQHGTLLSFSLVLFVGLAILVAFKVNRQFYRFHRDFCQFFFLKYILLKQLNHHYYLLDAWSCLLFESLAHSRARIVSYILSTSLLRIVFLDLKMDFESISLMNLLIEWKNSVCLLGFHNIFHCVNIARVSPKWHDFEDVWYLVQPLLLLQNIFRFFARYNFFAWGLSNI